MTFTELLAGYIGADIEVFLVNQFYAGKLASVANGYFILEVSGGSYNYGPPTQVTILNSSVQFVRILA
ncbi:MAG: hypothetical protein K0Q59_1718 [Paenibacillus sp.]|nr:hypothetical protein [Paenibacillus sp.]